jgi:hypothetical protein
VEDGNISPLIPDVGTRCDEWWVWSPCRLIRGERAFGFQHVGLRHRLDLCQKENSLSLYRSSRLVLPYSLHELSKLANPKRNTTHWMDNTISSTCNVTASSTDIGWNNKIDVSSPVITMTRPSVETTCEQENLPFTQHRYRPCGPPSFQFNSLRRLISGG